MQHEVPRAGGGTAVIELDEADVAILEARPWRVMPNGYVGVHGTLLHRVLMDPPAGLVIDHINHDKLDNRRVNLRIVSSSVNNRHHRVHAANVSRSRRGWAVYFSFGDRTRYYGIFADRAEADALAQSLRERIANGEEPESTTSNMGRSNVRNIYWHAQSKRWRVRVTEDGQRRHLGQYRTVQEATAALEAHLR